MNRVVELVSASGDTNARDVGPVPPTTVLLQFDARVNTPNHTANLLRLADHYRGEQLRRQFVQRMDGLFGEGKSAVRTDPDLVPGVTRF